MRRFPALFMDAAFALRQRMRRGIAVKPERGRLDKMDM